jgi:hypothetical protein
MDPAGSTAGSQDIELDVERTTVFTAALCVVVLVILNSTVFEVPFRFAVTIIHPEYAVSAVALNVTDDVPAAASTTFGTARATLAEVIDTAVTFTDAGIVTVQVLLAPTVILVGEQENDVSAWVADKLKVVT